MAQDDKQSGQYGERVRRCGAFAAAQKFCHCHCGITFAAVEDKSQDTQTLYKEMWEGYFRLLRWRRSVYRVHSLHIYTYIFYGLGKERGAYIYFAFLSSHSFGMFPSSLVSRSRHFSFYPHVLFRPYGVIWLFISLPFFHPLPGPVIFMRLFILLLASPVSCCCLINTHTLFLAFLFCYKKYMIWITLDLLLQLISFLKCDFYECCWRLLVKSLVKCPAFSLTRVTTLPV